MDRSPVIPGIAATLMVVGTAFFFAVLWNDVLVGAPRVAVHGGDLKPHPTDSSCSGRTWPYYDAQCLSDLRQPDGRARAVRIVASGSSARHIAGVK
jgi:hypothetical protein